MLDKGQEDDWFSSRFIIGCAIAAAVGIVVFISRELSTDHPIVDLRLFKKRNFTMTQIVMFMVGASLYSSTVHDPAVSAAAHGLLRGTIRPRPLHRRPGAHGALPRLRIHQHQARSTLHRDVRIHPHDHRSLPHDQPQPRRQLRHRRKLARCDRLRPALPLRAHQYHVLHRNSAEQVQRGERNEFPDAQRGRKRRHYPSSPRCWCAAPSLTSPPSQQT